jgi:uncharacterized protein (UPF0248 family)
MTNEVINNLLEIAELNRETQTLVLLIKHSPQENLKEYRKQLLIRKEEKLSKYDTREIEAVDNKIYLTITQAHSLAYHLNRPFEENEEYDDGYCSSDREVSPPWDDNEAAYWNMD